MTQDATTALRLRLPCPNCDELMSTMGYTVGTAVALSCTHCGYGWVESAGLDAALAQRVASFCATVPGATDPSVQPPAEPGIDIRRTGRGTVADN